VCKKLKRSSSGALRRKIETLKIGGLERIPRRYEQGKLTARERAEVLDAPGTFEEVDISVLKHGNMPCLVDVQKQGRDLLDE
jgi:acetyl-CoA carboxylase carboxyltransferase component